MKCCTTFLLALSIWICLDMVVVVTKAFPSFVTTIHSNHHHHYYKVVEKEEEEEAGGGFHFRLYAKKKGKKKGGRNNKKQQQSGFEWATNFKLKPSEAKVTRDLASAAAASFQARTGKPLCDELKGSSDLPKALWNAPIACIIVGKPDNDNNDESTDPSTTVVVKYANVAALETVGLKEEEYEKLIVGMSSEKQSVFINLPNEMKGDKKYEGRYTKCIFKGTKSNDVDVDENQNVTILNSHRWALENSALIGGKFVTTTIGVAYAWNTWQLGEDIICSPGGIQHEKIDTGDVAEAIEKQAMAIRELKEVQGFGNKDPEVMDAVAELLRLKALQEESA
jgi:hypothetical protein